MAFQLAKAYVELSQKGLGPVTGAIGGLASQLRGLVSPMALVSSGLAAIGAGAGIGGMLKLASDAESLAVSFEVLLGSAEAAKKMMADINAFAARTPYEQAELGAVAKQLLAFGVAQEDVIPTLGRLGDVAALSGSRINELAAIFGKVKQVGKADMEALKQFAERGIPVVAKLAEAYGVTTEEIWKMSSAGQIGFAQIQYALESLTGAGGMFEGGMARLAETTAGKWSTLTGNLKQTLAEIGQAMIDAFDLKGVMDSLSAFAASFMANYGDSLKSVLAAIGGAMKTAFQFLADNPAIAKTLLLVGGALSAMAVVVPVVGAAVAILGPVLAAAFTPVGLILLGIIGGLAAAGVAAWVFRDKVVSAMQTAWRYVSAGVDVIAFVASNWDLYTALMAAKVSLAVENMQTRIRTFADNVLGIFSWLIDNWVALNRDGANYIRTILHNLFKDIQEIVFAPVNVLLTGETGIDWTPLTEGYKSELTEFPKWTAAAVKESNAAIDAIEGQLAGRWLEQNAASPAALAAAAAEVGGGGAAPGVPPALRGGKTGGEADRKFAFVGLAALAEKMQTEAARQADRKQELDLARQSAEANRQLAEAAAGQGLRVIVQNPAPVPAWG